MTRPRPRSLTAAAATAALTALTLLLSACTSPASTAPAPTNPADPLTGEVTVFAAASLQTSFDDLAAQFEQAHPGVDVKPIVYDGSSTLATQLVEGAQADVFAAANTSTMQTVVDAGLAPAAPTIFATNTLEIAVPKGNPAGVTQLSDLARPGLKLVICAPDVPCGSATAKLAAAQGLSLAPVSEEQNVTAVLTKVRSGEADAGLVYQTDIATAKGDVEGVPAAGADAVVNSYPIAQLGASKSEAATAFVEFVIGPQGRATLASYGFGAPPTKP